MCRHPRVSTRYYRVLENGGQGEIHIFWVLTIFESVP